MAASQLRTVIHHLRKNLLAGDAAALTDGQLLESFINHRDESAFEALVRRHGPMVLGVCRRILRNHHDADDAFQATFLVLVRKAAAVVPREMVANFLYGVARTTAHRARVAAARRAVRERQVTAMPEPEARQPDELWQELQPLLDQELGRLPDKYRVPILLCDLEGKSIKQAARQLDWPQGTVAGRLARARALLAKRLGKYGLLTSSAALPPALAQNALASLPPALVSATIRAAGRLAMGNAAGIGLISAEVAALTEGVLKMMLFGRFKTIILVLAIAALVGGAGLLYRTQAAEPAAGAPQVPASPADRNDLAANDDADSAPPQPSNRSLLPTGPMPRQALVGLDKKGRLLVRTLDILHEPTAVFFQGKAYTRYETTEMLRTRHYDLRMVEVFTVHGASVSKRRLPELLKKETLALVSTDPQAADPLNLRLFKEDTLLFVLPSPPPVGAAEPVPVYGGPAPPPVGAAEPVPAYGGPATEPVPAYGGPAYGGTAPASADGYPPPGPPAIVPPPVTSPQTSIEPADVEAVSQPLGELVPHLIHAPNVKIPVAIAPERRAAVKELRLVASADKGKTWKCVATIPPDQDSVGFYAPKDGLYWLAVQTVTPDGKLEPKFSSLRPEIKVVVQTNQGP